MNIKPWIYRINRWDKDKILHKETEIYGTQREVDNVPLFALCLRDTKMAMLFR